MLSGFWIEGHLIYSTYIRHGCENHWILNTEECWFSAENLKEVTRKWSRSKKKSADTLNIKERSLSQGIKEVLIAQTVKNVKWCRWL